MMVTEELLAALGIEVLDIKGDELVALCPGHESTVGRADTSPSWSINAETGAHFCFSCGYKGGLAFLVSDMLVISHDEAKDWLAAAQHIDLDLLQRRLTKLGNGYISAFRLVPMSEARLAVFTDPTQEALDARGLTLEACLDHTVRWNPRDNSWILPIREAFVNKLLGWQEKGQGSRLFKNRPAGVQKSVTLFGLDVFERKSSTHMILVESPLDAVRLTSLKIDGGVSSYGSRVSDRQIFMLRGADRLLVAMDHDKAGIKASADIYDAARQYGFEPWFFNYAHTDKKDIGDMTEDEIRVGIAEAKHCSRGRSAYL
jgi:DNA primase